MTECKHEMALTDGEFFVGLRPRCVVCGLWEHEIKLGLGKPHEMVDEYGKVLAYGSLDDCMTEARKLLIRTPRRFVWMPVWNARPVMIRIVKSKSETRVSRREDEKVLKFDRRKH